MKFFRWMGKGIVLLLRGIGIFLFELIRGLVLIGKDIHKWLYKRFSSRTWWIYIFLLFLVYLWKIGKMKDFFTPILIFGLMLTAFWLIFRALFITLFGQKK